MNKERHSTLPLSQRLILFVTGDAPRTSRARANLSSALAQTGLDGWPLEIDLLKEPAQAIAFGMFATPALLLIDETRGRAVLYGDLSDERALRQFLDEL
jgi:circadian clock protein KaiB